MNQGVQKMLHDFHDPEEFTIEEVDTTLILHLRPPTSRKQNRIEAALEDASQITTEAANRMPGVPRERWGSARPKDNTWYKWAKEMDHDLSNKTAMENIQRVREAFRRWQSDGYDGEKPVFEKNDRCTFYYEQPKYEVHNDQYYLSLPFGAGRGQRELLPIRDGEYIREFIDGIRGDEYSKTRSELLRREDRYEFHQGIQQEVEVLANPKTRIGVDVGLTNIAAVGAVDEDGEKHGAHVWSGAEAAEYRDRFSRAKKRAQEEAKYEALRDDEHRYIEHLCHTISREVIDWTLEKDRPKIVLEDLTDIRDTFIKREREHTPEERRALHSWPFREVQGNIEYKAQEAGIPVEYLTPEETRNTSRECNECGHTEEDNREGVHFECLECGYTLNADINAAFNIGMRDMNGS